MSDQTILLYGAVASVLCLVFLIVTLSQYRKIGQESDRNDGLEPTKTRSRD